MTSNPYQSPTELREDNVGWAEDGSLILDRTTKQTTLPRVCYCHRRSRDIQSCQRSSNVAYFVGGNWIAPASVAGMMGCAIYLTAPSVLGQQWQGLATCAFFGARPKFRSSVAAGSGSPRSSDTALSELGTRNSVHSHSGWRFSRLQSSSSHGAECIHWSSWHSLLPWYPSFASWPMGGTQRRSGGISANRVGGGRVRLSGFAPAFHETRSTQLEAGAE